MSIRSEVHELGSELEGAAQHTKPWVVALGRAGYVARAVLYLTIGMLAVMTALGEGGHLTDSKGALDELYRQPLGMVLIALMSIGLAGYGVWRVVQAVVNPADEATGRWQGFRRAGWVLGALVHFGLAAYAVSLLGGTAHQHDVSAQGSAATALSAGPSVGPAVVALVGASLVGLGVHEIFCAWRAKLDQQLDLSPLSVGVRRSIVQLGRVGIAARGAVFGISGAFLVSAGMTSDPGQAKGFAEALQVVREAPYGRALLAIIALGLIAFSAYQAVEARFRRLFGMTGDDRAPARNRSARYGQ